MKEVKTGNTKHANLFPGQRVATLGRGLRSVDRHQSCCVRKCPNFSHPQCKAILNPPKSKAQWGALPQEAEELTLRKERSSTELRVEVFQRRSPLTVGLCRARTVQSPIVSFSDEHFQTLPCGVVQGRVTLGAVRERQADNRMRRSRRLFGDLRVRSRASL